MADLPRGRRVGEEAITIIFHWKLFFSLSIRVLALSLRRKGLLCSVLERLLYFGTEEGGYSSLIR
jgi:hypothetical protein